MSLLPEPTPKQLLPVNPTGLDTSLATDQANTLDIMDTMDTMVCMASGEDILDMDLEDSALDTPTTAR